MCKINIEIVDENALYFVISNTILSYEKESFTINDIVTELETKGVEYENLKMHVKIAIDKLVENCKIIADPRIYRHRK